MKTTTIKEIIIDTGNNGSASIGIYKECDGSYLAMTLAHSVTRKTLRGAEKWLKGRIGATRFAGLQVPQ